MVEIPGSKILDAVQDVRTALARLSAVEDTLDKINDALNRLDERLRIVEADVKVAEAKAMQAATSVAAQESRDLMGQGNAALLNSIVDIRVDVERLKDQRKALEDKS